MTPDCPAIIGRYRVMRLIGEGAMGRVLLAHDPVLDRRVALKHIRGDLQIPREVKEGLIVRMRHEARAAARVAHPNLVTLHDMGEDAELGLYLVFEYVEGPTLKQRLAEGSLSPLQAARLVRELGEALTFAHRAGIVHRDIKPENIILSSTGGKVADFGIARIPDSTLTHQGGLMGTPAYSAPETFYAGKFSPLSDQFSLAAVMYEALSGRRAFPGDDAVSVAAKIAHESPSPISAALGLKSTSDQVLLRALAKAPSERYATCEAFGLALAESIETSLASGPASHRSAGAFTTKDAADSQRNVDVDDPEMPKERKLGQVVLGAAVVVATAALLLHTALRSADAPADDAKAALTAIPALTTSAVMVAPTTLPSRTARPRADLPMQAGHPHNADEGNDTTDEQDILDAGLDGSLTTDADGATPATTQQTKIDAGTQDAGSTDGG